MPQVLGPRTLNRATLARQFLLERTTRSVPEVVEHLVGLQAQTPHSWYLGLWSRIAGFRPEAAADRLTDRSLVRIALMRSTIHLVTARDAHGLRAAIQPVLDRDLFTNQLHGDAVRGLDVDEIVAAARPLLAERARTSRELGALLQDRWPDRPAAGLAYAVRNRLPLVQVPPRGLWGRSGPIAHTSAESWVGDGAPFSLETLVRRYLAAFGPATVMDVQTWSGLTHLREVVEPLRSQLRLFHDECGRELFDLPDAPRPDAATPAPVRFLYDFDNLLLSHADRNRVSTDEFRRAFVRRSGPVPGAVLVDGFTAAHWTLTRDRETARLEVHPHRPLTGGEAEAVHAEAAMALAFMAPNAGKVALLA
ncbi:winged helix DNA-binding domain-containing protein [Pseudonocardia sp. DSM 110487]|uniref:winged helix DNA-binding domain-containing protein n=1 Tax=Pseudonocardia sp. DSM 110487 TaxID=2865833 RepID=UPI001C69704C|nr:winged helix DNA-binding domain-containing protein [Pseudonocardia sp. DSM 110487]QYN34728.1 winged helix DNA-binding domain-containing protein [Pseudonocardia sp. DSM 110487]